MSKFSFSGQTGADLVVYGKVFTAEGNQLAEAFAVKDGRYVYVGDRKGAEAFIEAGRTEVVDHTGKGLVMPSCGNGHAHYFTGHAMHAVGAVVGGQDDVDIPYGPEPSEVVRMSNPTNSGLTFWNILLTVKRIYVKLT